MDSTRLFRQIVSEVASRCSMEDDCLSVAPPDKTRILPKARTTHKASQKKSALEAKARAIQANIYSLKDFLASNRTAYTDIVLNRDHSVRGLSDLERDRIDAGANSLIQTIGRLITSLKKELMEAKHLPMQHVQHLEAVCDFLQVGLKQACAQYSEQKAIRVERELELQKLARLELNARSHKKTQSRPEGRHRLASHAGSQDSGDEIGMPCAEEDCVRKAASEESEDEGPLSVEEEQLLQAENDRMYQEFFSLRDDLQQIETKVVKIAELQEIFTEKVLQQKADIELVSQSAVSATENVKDGNEELRKAIQSNASIRVYILFFLLVMSFSLLFLDWYNE